MGMQLSMSEGGMNAEEPGIVLEKGLGERQLSGISRS